MSGYLQRGNKLWEGSRMFLPEHKQALLKWQKEQEKQAKPELDEQQLEEMNRMLISACRLRVPVTVRFFEAGNFLTATGTITKFRPLEKKLELAGETGERISIKLSAVTEVERA